MRQQLAFGSVIGATVSLLCWSGNRTPSLVSTFPDGATLVALVILLVGALWFEHRRLPADDRDGLHRVGFVIGASAGVVFGVFVAMLGLARFSSPTPILMAVGFLTAFGSTLILGVAAAALMSSLRTRQNRLPRGAA